MNWNSMFFSAADAAELAALALPAMRRAAIEGLIDLMRAEPDPIRTQAAVELCRHIASVGEVRPTEARDIVAEAVGVIRAYLN